MAGLSPQGPPQGPACEGLLGAAEGSRSLAGNAGQECPDTARPCAGRVPKGRAAPGTAGSTHKIEGAHG